MLEMDLGFAGFSGKKKESAFGSQFGGSRRLLLLRALSGEGGSDERPSF